MHQSSHAPRTALTLAHSPDSDDMVMWWPIIGARDPQGQPIEGLPYEPPITSDRFTFTTIARDVQQLNELALQSEATETSVRYDITAISAATYPHIARTFQITRSGGSFGERYGPKVVVRADSTITTIDELVSRSNTSTRIAVPGKNTTAFMLLSMIVPNFEPVFMPFDDVIDAVLAGDADAGLLIHEAQLTFADMGLRAVLDLGVWWHERESLPLPLGLNVLRRDLDTRYGAGSCAHVASLLSQSIRYAVEHKEMSKRYLRAHAGDRPEWRDDALLDRYLSMYVSPLTLDMGETGIRALERLYALAESAGAVSASCSADPV